MNRARSAVLRLLLVGSILAVSGCDTMSGVRDRIGSIDIPRFGSGSKDKAEPGEAQTPLVAARAVDCPRVGVVEDLNSVTQFITDSAGAGDEISRARLANIQSQCAVNENNVIVDMDIIIDSSLGPRARVMNTDKPSFSYPYFIALTTPNGDIAAKEVFSATIAYDAGEDTRSHAENLRQVIPLTGAYNASDYEILIGFQLTETELTYNRHMAAQGLAPLQPRIHSVRPASAAFAPAVPADNVEPPAPIETPPPPPPEPVAHEPVAQEPVAHEPAAHEPAAHEQEQTIVAPLYPVKPGQAPPPPRVIPRVEID